MPLFLATPNEMPGEDGTCYAAGARRPQGEELVFPQKLSTYQQLPRAPPNRWPRPVTSLPVDERVALRGAHRSSAGVRGTPAAP